MRSSGSDAHEPMPPRILIVAYGNPLRSDDGAGWHAAEILRRELESSRTWISWVHQLTPELSEAASRADAVIFIDTACNGTPGQIACTQVEPEPEVCGTSHRLSPGQILALCSELYAATPRGFTVSIAGQFFDHGDALSAAVQQAMPRLIETVKELMARLEASPRPVA